MNLADLIDRNAAFTPDRTALRFEGRALSYAAFAHRVAEAAHGLARLGVRRGDRVAVLAHNHPDTLTLLYACARLGAMLAPLNWRLTPAELLFILQDAGAAVLAVGEASASALSPLTAALPGLRLVGLDFAPDGGEPFDALLGGAGGGVHGDLEARLLLVYTSGTTGRPKGAVLTGAALLANGVMSQHMHGLTGGDQVLTVLPLFHVGGLNIQTTPALHLGATVTLHARFDPGATLTTIAADRPTLTVLVPSTLQALVEHPGWPEADLSGLRAVATGSSSVPQRLVDAFTDRGVPVLQVYGSTETCPIAVYTRLGADPAPPDSTGHPGLLCEAMVADDAGAELPPGASGEVLVRGPNVLLEYWGNPAATAAALHDGWFRTGDIGIRSPDGSFAIGDRRANLIVSGGENVYPAEVERALLEHPGVAEAAVIGRPDPRWQRVPVAFVVCRRGHAPSAEALVAHLRGQLAGFKVPRTIRFVGSLPRNAMGKVQHFLLRDEPTNQ